MATSQAMATRSQPTGPAKAKNGAKSSSARMPCCAPAPRLAAMITGANQPSAVPMMTTARMSWAVSCDMTGLR